MAEVKSIPNTTSNWKDAASYIIKTNKTCSNGVQESTDEYAERLKQTNPHRPSPKSADIRWWPWLHHAILDEEIVLKAPDPVCKEPPPPPVTPPPVAPPVAPPPTTPPVEPPPAETPVSNETREKGKRAIARANGTVAKLSTVGGTSGGQISRAKDEAQQALEGTSDEKAKKAIERLNSASSRGEAEYKKIRGDL